MNRKKKEKKPPLLKPFSFFYFTQNVCLTVNSKTKFFLRDFDIIYRKHCALFSRLQLTNFDYILLYSIVLIYPI